MIGVSILAYGEEYVNECNNLLKQLSIYPNLQFYITTNLPELILKINNLTTIKTNEPFNYNLKRLGFETALLENDCVVQLDTDIYIKGSLDFKMLYNIEDGMYLRWKQVMNNNLKLSSEIEYQYIDKLKSLTNLSELFFIDESTLIFKITDKSKKESLVKWWNDLYFKTKDVQPRYRNEGAVEGLLIYSGCVLSNIKVFDGLSPIIDNILHYLKYGKINLNKNII
jgi:hypothetical protein